MKFDNDLTELTNPAKLVFSNIEDKENINNLDHGNKMWEDIAGPSCHHSNLLSTPSRIAQTTLSII